VEFFVGCELEVMHFGGVYEVGKCFEVCGRVAVFIGFVEFEFIA